MIFFDSRGNYLLGASILLSTRTGRPIKNERRQECNPARLQAAEQLFKSNHESIKTRSLSGLYNCMGMVFAARRTWIEPDQLDLILEDDGYRKLNSIGDAAIGDVIVYKSEGEQVTHVGLISDIKANYKDGSNTITVLSQWGQDGEYFHRIDDVHSSLGKPKEIWIDRK